MNFTVIDVETANPKRASICEVGIVVVKSGKIVDTWSQLVNPRTDYWGRYNTRTHGIYPYMVRDMPTFDDIYPEIERSFARRVRVVSHSKFDKTAISQSCKRHSLPTFTNKWRDSIYIAKIAWPGLPSYKLSILAEYLGISYDAHKASDDAKAVATLVLRAGAVIGTQSVNDWLNRGEI